MGCTVAWQMFQLSVDQFDALHYGGMALFKIGILSVPVLPYDCRMRLWANTEERGMGADKIGARYINLSLLWVEVQEEKPKQR